MPLLSRTLRDIILYSYPNSISRLATAPGGLRLSLPLKDVMDSSSISENASKKKKKKKSESSVDEATDTVLTKISSRTKLGNDDDVLARLETILENDDKVANEDETGGRKESRKSRTQSSNDFDADVDDEYSMEDGIEEVRARYIVDCSNPVCVLAIRRQKSC